MKRRSDTINVLDFIEKDDPLRFDDCNDLADAIVQRTGQERELHWSQSAMAHVAGVAATIVGFGKRGESRSLSTLREIISSPDKLEMSRQLMTETGGLLADMGGYLGHFQDKEKSSVLTTTLNNLSFLGTSAMAEHLKTSSYDPISLTTSKVSVFCILPPDRMHAQGSYLRLMLWIHIRACVRAGRMDRPVHFMIDEAAAVGHLDVIDDAIAMGRAYGIRLIFIFQSPGQLKKCFPENEQTFLANTSQTYFATKDFETAKRISDSCGEQTIVVESESTSIGSSGSTQRGHHGSVTAGWSKSRNRNWNKQKPALMTPDEILSASPRQAITFAPGMRPILTHLLRYYEETQLFRRTGWFWRQWYGLQALTRSAALCATSLVAAVGLTQVAQRSAGMAAAGSRHPGGGTRLIRPAGASPPAGASGSSPDSGNSEQSWGFQPFTRSDYGNARRDEQSIEGR